MAATRKPDQSELSFQQECTVHEKALTDFGTFFGSALIPFNASTLQPKYPLSFEGLRILFILDVYAFWIIVFAHHKQMPYTKLYL